MGRIFGKIIIALRILISNSSEINRARVKETQRSSHFFFHVHLLLHKRS